jgi:hypothetical protein
VAVLGRRLILLLVLAALLIGGCGGSGADSDATSKTATKSGSTRTIMGPWAGKLTQAGLAPFRVATIVNSDGTGLVAYTGIDCTGHWTLKSGEDPQYVFVEQITSGSGGNCKGSGTVNLVKTSAGTLRYRFTGGGVTSEGLLMPASVRAVFAIFRRTGHTFKASIADKLPK